MVPAGTGPQSRVKVERSITQVWLNEVAGSRSVVLKLKARFCTFCPVKSLAGIAPTIWVTVRMVKSGENEKPLYVRLALVPAFVAKLRDTLRVKLLFGSVD